MYSRFGVPGIAWLAAAPFVPRIGILLAGTLVFRLILPHIRRTAQESVRGMVCIRRA